jgi:signal transduction histidine kinase
MEENRSSVSLKHRSSVVRSYAEPCESWLQLALDCAQMCAYKWDLKSGTIVRSSRSAPGAMLDPDRSSWIYAEDNVIIHPDDRALVDESVAEAIQTHREFNIEFRATPKDSRIRWLECRGHAIYDDHDEAVQILSVTQDITQKKEDELVLKNKTIELELAKETLRIALDAGNLVVIAGAGEPFNVKSPELCRLLDIADENTDITSEVFISRMHPDDREEAIVRKRQFQGQSTKFDREMRFLLSDGSVRWISVKGARLKENNVGPLRNYFVFHDVTKIKESEEQVKLKNQDLSIVNEKLERFSSIVAHDLKGPLSSISLAADLIVRAHSMNEVSKSAKFIKSGITRMTNFISNLLEFAKSENNGGLLRENVSLEDVIETVKINLRADIAENHAQIEIGTSLPKVPGYSTQLLQLFQNLISNALKFRSSENPMLILNVKEDGDHWLVTLKDNGLGIDSDKSQLVFEPFQRFHSDKADGTGLGLSICKKIVELHGGKIWVDSQPGVGSQFSFTLSGATLAYGK